MKLCGNVFVIGFKISAPIVATILIMDITIGVLSKTIPQLNIFVVGMPLKIILGIVVLIITLPNFLRIIQILIMQMDVSMAELFKDMVE